MKFLLVSILLAFCVLNTACSNLVSSNDEISSKEYKLSPFDELEVSNGFKVILKKSDSNKVEVSANDNLHQYINVRLTDSELKISKSNSVDFDNKANITITVYYSILKDVEGTGGTNFIVDGSFTNELDVKLSGNSNFEGVINSSKLEAELSGNSTLNITGSASKFDLDMSGSSSMKGYDFSTDNFDGEFSGGSIAELYVHKTLKLEASGGSILNFKGDPSILKAELTGGSEMNDK